MNDQHNLLDTITNAFVPIHRDGYKFVAGAAIATLLLFLVAPPLGWIAALLTAACAYFFRDPDRVTPDRPGLIVSAADGKVSAVVEDVPAPRELALGTERLMRISVFLSVFDVHVIRAPVGGKVIHSAYVPGAFLNAELDKASEENERQALVIETKSGGSPSQADRAVRDRASAARGPGIRRRRRKIISSFRRSPSIRARCH